jgi:hypothetical protein
MRLLSRRDNFPNFFIYGAGVEPSSLFLRPFGLLYQPWIRDGDNFGAISGMIEWQGKPKYSEKTCPGAAVITTDTTSLDLDSNLGCSRRCRLLTVLATARPFPALERETNEVVLLEQVFTAVVLLNELSKDCRRQIVFAAYQITAYRCLDDRFR